MIKPLRISYIFDENHNKYVLEEVLGVLSHQKYLQDDPRQEKWGARGSRGSPNEAKRDPQMVPRGLKGASFWALGCFGRAFWAQIGENWVTFSPREVKEGKCEIHEIVEKPLVFVCFLRFWGVQGHHISWKSVNIWKLTWDCHIFWKCWVRDLKNMKKGTRNADQGRAKGGQGGLKGSRHSLIKLRQL